MQLNPNVSRDYFNAFGFYPYPCIEFSVAKEQIRLAVPKKPDVAFSFAIAKAVKTGKKPVVLLSGGLDSRYILAELLEVMPPSEIITITYGTPKTWDYDFGNLVADFCKTTHYNIDLSQWKPTSAEIGELWEITHKRHHPLFIPPWTKIKEILPENALVYTGYLGDFLTLKSQEWDFTPFESIRSFVKNYGKSKSEAEAELLTQILPWIGLSDFGDFERLDFELYHGRALYEPYHPIGIDTFHPFLDPIVASSWLSLHEERDQQSLYRQILRTKHPKLFRLPTKNRNGLGLYTPGIVEFFYRKIEPFIHRKILGGRNRSTNYADYPKDLFKPENYA